MASARRILGSTREHTEEGVVTMIHIYLSARALNAARTVDSAVSAAAVHAAVEIAVAEELLLSLGRPHAEVKARAEELLRGPSSGSGEALAA